MLLHVGSGLSRWMDDPDPRVSQDSAGLSPASTAAWETCSQDAVSSVLLTSRGKRKNAESQAGMPSFACVCPDPTNPNFPHKLTRDLVQTGASLFSLHIWEALIYTWRGETGRGGNAKWPNSTNDECFLVTQMPKQHFHIYKVFYAFQGLLVFLTRSGGQSVLQTLTWEKSGIGVWRASWRKAEDHGWMVKPDLLCSPAQLLGWVMFSGLYNTARPLSIFVLDGRHKSLEGPKMSLLTKLVFVARFQCPHYAQFLVGSCRQITYIEFGYTENPFPRLACRSQCRGRRWSYCHWNLLS